MKKKIDKLRRDGRLEGNTAFEALWGNYQQAETAYEQAKTDRKIAKSTYHFELDAEGKDEARRDRIFELDLAVRRADGQRLIQRADFQLAKYRLRRWLDAFGRLPEASADEPKKQVKSKAPKAKATPAAKPPKATASVAAPAAAPRRKTKSKA